MPSLRSERPEVADLHSVVLAFVSLHSTLVPMPIFPWRPSALLRSCPATACYPRNDPLIGTCICVNGNVKRLRLVLYLRKLRRFYPSHRFLNVQAKDPVELCRTLYVYGRAMKLYSMCTFSSGDRLDAPGSIFCLPTRLDFEFRKPCLSPSWVVPESSSWRPWRWAAWPTLLHVAWVLYHTCSRLPVRSPGDRAWQLGVVSNGEH